MFNKKIIIILISVLLYQSPLLSKCTSFDEFSSRNLSQYFSGFLALENKNNSEALDFFNSSKILINQHEPYLERLVTTLVLEDKVPQAINFIRINSEKSNSQFFEAYILLALDNLKKNKINKAIEVLSKIPEDFKRDRFNFIIANSLIQYANVIRDKEIKVEKTKLDMENRIQQSLDNPVANQENNMPYGPVTYGSKRGRPPVKKTVKKKAMTKRPHMKKK